MSGRTLPDPTGGATRGHERPAGESLRVLHSVHCWLPQTASWLCHQVRCLPADIESHVVCRSTENLEQYSVPRIHCLADLSRLQRLARHSLATRLGRRGVFELHVAGSVRPAVMHSHFGNVGWENLAVARRVGARHVVTFYGYDVGMLPRTQPVWHERYRELFAAVDRVLCEGPFMASAVVELGCPRSKVRVHHLGVMVDAMRFAPRQWQPGERLRVLIAGSFREKKGIPYAVRALGAIASEVELEVTIIGDAGSDERSQAEKAAILAAIEETHLGPRVRLMGYQPYSVFLHEAYRHHVYLSPSVCAADGDTEGGAPVALIEMAASGMPVVSTRHCDIPNVVVDGETGLLAGERDVDGLVAALRRLVAEPAAWGRMALAARKRVEVHFSGERQGRELAALYGELAGTRP